MRRGFEIMIHNKTSLYKNTRRHIYIVAIVRRVRSSTMLNNIYIYISERIYKHNALGWDFG